METIDRVKGFPGFQDLGVHLLRAFVSMSLKLRGSLTLNPKP